jgi:sugar lactone lactonase YvrE
MAADPAATEGFASARQHSNMRSQLHFVAVVGTVAIATLAALTGACAPLDHVTVPPKTPAKNPNPNTHNPPPNKLPLPLAKMNDVALPGGANRFDYEDIDVQNGHLFVAHMGDGVVDVANVSDGSFVATVPNVATARGICAAPEVNRIFASADGSNEMVIIDATTLSEKSRVPASSPDGIGYDADDHIVGISEQGPGKVAFYANDGDGARTDVEVGSDTGNTVYDPGRKMFFVAVKNPDQLVAVDPHTLTTGTRIDLPGCGGAHGVRIHPDDKSALVACEDNDTVARVDLDTHDVVIAATGGGPDVMAIDTDYLWLYIASESGDLKVYDIGQAGLTVIDDETPGDNAHSVAVDVATHRVFFPLRDGGNGTPVLRIMKP